MKTYIFQGVKLELKVDRNRGVSLEGGKKEGGERQGGRKESNDIYDKI